MKTYCTLDDLQNGMSQKTLVELSNDDPMASDVSEPVIDHVISMAAEEIDGYLRGRYQLPLTVVPTMVRQLSIDVVRYHLYARRSEGTNFPPAILERYKQAIVKLENLREGLISLGQAEGDQQGSDVLELGEIKVAKRTRLFDKRFLEQF